MNTTKKRKSSTGKRGMRWEVSHSYMIYYNHLMKSQLFANIHFKCHLLYEALLNTLAKIYLFCYVPLTLPISIPALSILPCVRYKSIFH